MENNERNSQEMTSLLLDDEFLESIFANKDGSDEALNLKDVDTAPVDEETEEIKSILLDKPERSEPVHTGEPAESRRKKEKKNPWQKDLLLYVHDLVYLLAAVIVIFLLCFRVVVVSGTSMYSTLWDGDYLLLLSNVFYGDPQQGDIIVASKESFKDGEPIVKRVIATEGQTVDIDFTKGLVYVGDNPIPLDEPYIYSPTYLNEGMEFPAVVPEGCVFVMGDNRMASRDSRYPQIGFVDEREILGKVIFLFLPGTNGGENPRDFDRIGVVS